ncbi:MAG: hypothetical protein ACTSRZ_05970 [Promethearchaeota archaeon]
MKNKIFQKGNFLVYVLIFMILVPMAFLAINIGVNISRDVNDNKLQNKITAPEGSTFIVSNVGTIANSSYGLDVHHNLVYLASYSDGLVIVNISDPSNPIEIGAYNGLTHAIDVKVYNDIAFVIDSEKHFVCINVSSPENPSFISNKSFGGITDNIAFEIDGTIAYFFIDTYMRILNISDLSNIQEIHNQTLPSVVRDSEIYNDILYLALGTNGVSNINISNPLQPITYPAILSGKNTKGIYINNGYLYVACGTDGLYSIEIGETLTELNNINVNSSNLAYITGDNSAIIASTTDGKLLVFDATDPANLRYMFSKDVGYNIRKMRKSGIFLYGSGEHGLTLFKLRDQLNPADSFLNSPYGVYPPTISVEDIKYYNGSNSKYNKPQIIAAEKENGISIYELKQSSIEFLGSYQTGGIAHEIALNSEIGKDDEQGVLAYIASDTQGLICLNITDPTNITKVSQIVSVYWAYGVKLLHHPLDGKYYALVSDYSYGFKIVDITNPLNMQLISTISEPQGARDCFPIFITMNGIPTVSVFIASDTNGIFWYNISNPSSPISINSLDTEGESYALVVDGWNVIVADGSWGLRIMQFDSAGVLSMINPNFNTDGIVYDLGYDYYKHYAYLADYNYGLRIVDCSTPTSMSEVKNVDTSGNALGVETVIYYGQTSPDNFTLVADDLNGIRYINITDPSNAEDLFGTIYNFTNINDFEIYNEDILAIADSDAGLVMLNVKNKSRPYLMGMYNSSGTANYTSIDKDYAYLADGADGVKIIDIKDPSNPTKIGEITSIGTVEELLVENDIAYIPNATHLMIYNMTDKSSPSPISTLSISNIKGMEKWGRYLYLVESSGALTIIDCSNPQMPMKLSTTASVGTPNDIAVSGNFAFIAAGNSGVRIFNISDPYNPNEVASITSITQVTDVKTKGMHLYVFSASDSFRIYDVMKYSNIQLIGNYTLTNPVSVLKLGDTFTYLADTNLGVLVLKTQYAGMDDLDDDQLSYIEEEWKYGTSNIDNDFDGDSMPDGWESMYGLNPLSDSDKFQDPDNDTVLNIFEYGNNTNPTDPDTDGDGCDDGWEIAYGFNPTSYDSDQDPDQDGLNNAQEYNYGTDPFEKDTDGDGYSDSEEVAKGTDPTDARSKPVEMTRIFVIIAIIGVILGSSIGFSYVKSSSRIPIDIIVIYSKSDKENKNIVALNKLLIKNKLIKLPLPLTSKIAEEKIQIIKELISTITSTIFVITNNFIEETEEIPPIIENVNKKNMPVILMVDSSIEQQKFKELENKGIIAKQNIIAKIDFEEKPVKNTKELSMALKNLEKKLKMVKKAISQNDEIEIESICKEVDISEEHARNLIEFLNYKIPLCFESKDGKSFVNAKAILAEMKKLSIKPVEESVDLVIKHFNLAEKEKDSLIRLFNKKKNAEFFKDIHEKKIKIYKEFILKKKEKVVETKKSKQRKPDLEPKISAPKSCPNCNKKYGKELQKAFLTEDTFICPFCGIKLKGE